ncbi:MAG: nucleotidyltransferase family protein [Thaumarchaeota archaeon]|nr:nucleotidyltransferase family protein [Nitrososphaerota archaeon]
MAQRTEAAILCGGRGERLRPLTDFFQKTMIPVGPQKLPLLAYIIKMAAHHGITKISLLTGYKSGDIREYFGDGSKFGVTLSYSKDAKDRPGSMNAVASALKGGAVSECDELLVYYGDVLSELDITSLLKTHREKGADATLVLAKGYTLPVGIADVEGGGFVSRVREKPKLELDVMTGCMVLGQKAMELVVNAAGPGKTDLMTHFVPELLASGGKVAAFFTEGIWHDVGSITSFETLNSELSKKSFAYMS